MNMARRTCFVQRTFCALLVLLWTLVALSGSETSPHLKEHYKYLTDVDSYDDWHLELKDELRKKRDIIQPESEVTSTNPITDNRTNQQSKNATLKNDKKKVLSSKTKSVLANTAPSVSPKLNDTLAENSNTTLKNNSTNATQRDNVTSVPSEVQQQSSSTINPTITPETDYEDSLTLDDFDEDEEGTRFNKTLKDHNIASLKTDSHVYYNSSLMVNKALANYYWVNMSNNKTNFKINAMLSKSHRRAATVKLSFDFPFYGHLIRNVTVATGGFIYTGEYTHSWLAATQYVAPLMANFDTRLSNDSYIKYVDNGTSFTVQWENVVLQDNPEDGKFTFQTTLFDNGDIVFVYEKVPVNIENITDDFHPVKVGLSDAYVIDRTIYFVRRKTIYEYHRVHFQKEDIANSTVIFLQAQPTCLNHKDCQSCLTSNINSFECSWCPSSNRCSTGLDRYRQDWLMKKCDRKQIFNESQCNQADNIDFAIHDHDENGYYFGPTKNDHDHDPDHDHDVPISGPKQNRTDEKAPTNSKNSVNNNKNTVVSDSEHSSDLVSAAVHASRLSPDRDINGNMGASGIVTILFLIALVGGAGIWVVYAYRNPHTTSGQMLIRYRPSQWRWRRGEARYTAATIHM